MNLRRIKNILITLIVIIKLKCLHVIETTTGPLHINSREEYSNILIYYEYSNNNKPMIVTRFHNPIYCSETTDNVLINHVS